MTQVVALLGANLGNREATMRRAAFALAEAPGVRLKKASRLFETAPWGKADQPFYLNAALELETSLEPESLLDLFQQTEWNLGRRPKKEQWDARIIDIDIVFYGERIIETERLQVPHPRFAERVFALEPLLDLRPDLQCPKTGARLADLLEQRKPYPPKECQPGPPLMEASAVFASRAAAFFEQAEAGANMLLESPNPEATEALGRAAAEGLQGGEVFALLGKLGAGKTCFTRGVARGLGIESPISSPSYVLVKSYEGRLQLHHADFYRLNAGTEEAGPSLDLASLGLEDYLDDPAAVLFIEWADRRPGWLEPPFWLAGLTGEGERPRHILLWRPA